MLNGEEYATAWVIGCYGPLILIEGRALSLARVGTMLFSPIGRLGRFWIAGTIGFFSTTGGAAFLTIAAAFVFAFGFFDFGLDAFPGRFRFFATTDFALSFRNADLSFFTFFFSASTFLLAMLPPTTRFLDPSS